MPDFQLFVQKSNKLLTETQKLQRFFNYILDFKLGQQKSYRIGETSNFRLKQHNQQNKEDDQILSQSSIPNIIVSSQSLRVSSYLRRTQEKQSSAKRQNMNECMNMVHYGYSCDKCYANPIVGERYTCKLCDFDLCQSCYVTNLQASDDSQRKLADQLVAFSGIQCHEHPLERVEKKMHHSLRNFKQLLSSGRRQKSLFISQNNSLLRSQKLHKSSK